MRFRKHAGYPMPWNLMRACRSTGPTCFLIFALALACGGPAASAGGQPGLNEETASRLLLQTSLGTIEIELFPAAAPNAVKRLRQLVEEGRDAGGFYSRLSFDFTRPHVEILTAGRHGPAAVTIPTELDAESLGLDQLLVSDNAEAMAIVQRELLVEHRKKKKSGQISDRLGELLERWYEGHSAKFLIGMSRKEINEALGYEYQTGLRSRSAKRGAVLLQPVSPTVASVRLSILLTDMPSRTGRWMVIGEVVRGLDVAQAISVKPRVKDRRRQYEPIEPVVIERVWIAPVATAEASPGGN